MRLLHRIVAWFAQARPDKGLLESLRDHERREWARGVDLPRWRFDREIAELKQQGRIEEVDDVG